jgi:DNA-binding MarR family transcriptional regulator
MSEFSSHGSTSFDAFALAVFDVTTALNTAGDALTKPLGQSSARWRVLGRISQGPQTVSQIAQRIGHARQGVQRIADDLVELGLARYSPVPSDRRTQWLQLTDEGTNVLTAIESEQALWTRRLAGALGEDALDRLTAELATIHATITVDFQQNFVQND